MRLAEQSLTAVDVHQAPAPPGRRRHELLSAVWAVSAAFGCYFCMYAFRKPFTAGSYSETTLFGLGFKTVLVTAQVAGYMVSKFIGIKVVSEMTPSRRALAILWLILAAEGTLVLFGLVPRPWNAICLFGNGLPLGMIFGLILGSLEGRRLTEALTAGLCASFILADGVTKTAGTWLLSQGVPEDWMPSLAGLIFLLPLIVCVAMLARIPEPSACDIAARTRRVTMSSSERWSFLRRYAIGLTPLVLMYLAVTIARSIRADFAPEIWRGLGTAAAPAIFTSSEMFVALGVVLVNGAAVLIADNRKAFFTSLATCGLGFALMAGALIGRRAGMLDAFAFMVLIGLGLYLPYVAMHTTVFERLLGMTRDRGNVGFLLYVVDSVGYLGYVCVMLARNLWPAADDLLGLLTLTGWLTVALSTLCLCVTWGHFSKRAAAATDTGSVPESA